MPTREVRTKAIHQAPFSLLGRLRGAGDTCTCAAPGFLRQRRCEGRSSSTVHHNDAADHAVAIVYMRASWAYKTCSAETAATSAARTPAASLLIARWPMRYTSGMARVLHSTETRRMANRLW